MAVKTVFAHEIYHNIGLSTDTKPAGQTPLSTFYEYNTYLPYVTYDGTNWVIDTRGSKSLPFEVRVSKAIDASIGAYTAGDMVNDDDCCTTATYWTLAGMAAVEGGYGAIIRAGLFNETENQAVQYSVLLFNAVPSWTGVEFTDNTANVHPNKADMTKWIDDIDLPTSTARGAAIATTTSATPSTTGKLPLIYKCAAGSTSLYFVLVTRTAYTQTATDDIELAFLIEHL